MQRIAGFGQDQDRRRDLTQSIRRHGRTCEKPGNGGRDRGATLTAHRRPYPIPTGEFRHPRRQRDAKASIHQSATLEHQVLALFASGRGWVPQNQTLHAIGMRQSQCQRRTSTHRVSNDAGAVDAERVHQAEHVLRQGRVVIVG